jgi:hypothetical protein
MEVGPFAGPCFCAEANSRWRGGRRAPAAVTRTRRRKASERAGDDVEAGELRGTRSAKVEMFWMFVTRAHSIVSDGSLNCFRCFGGLLQWLHMDIAKVDQDVAHVARVCSRCFICF